MTLLRWLTFLIRSQTVILVVLPFWIYLFLVMLVFVLQQLSLHWEILISVSIESPSSSQQDSLFHHIAYHYSRLIGMVFMIIWEMFHGRISKLAASAAASELCEWVQVGIDVYIPHHKYRVKPNSSLWFSAACAATIVHRNHCFHLYQNNKSSEFKV